MSGTFFEYNRDHPLFPYQPFNGNDPVPLGQRLIRLNSFSPNYHGYFIPEMQLHDFYYYPHDIHFNDIFEHDYSSYHHPTRIIHRKSQYNQGCDDHHYRPQSLHYKFISQ